MYSRHLHLVIITLLLLSAIPFLISSESTEPSLYVVGHHPVGNQLGNDPEIYAYFSTQLDAEKSFIEVTGIDGYSVVNGTGIVFESNETLEWGARYEVIAYAKVVDEETSDTFTWYFTVTDKGEVYGKVLSFEGDPLEGAEIYIDDDRVDITDGGGAYSFSYVMGNHSITVRKDGYREWEGRLWVRPGESSYSGVVVLKKERSDRTFFCLALAAIAMIALIGVAFLMTKSYLKLREFRDPKNKWKRDKRKMKEILKKNGLETDLSEMDLYEKLGLSYNASVREVNRAFDRLSKRYDHRSTNPYGDDLDESTYRYAEILAARDILSNRITKALHDRVMDHYSGKKL